MENDSTVIGGVLCFLERVELGGVDEWALMCFVSFRAHTICYNHVLEAAFLADIIVLCRWLVASPYIDLQHIRLENLFLER